MAEETKKPTTQTQAPTTGHAPAGRYNPANRGQGQGGGRNNNNRSRRRNNDDKPRDEFDTKIVMIRRVSRTYKGGKRMRISVCVAVGDRLGRVGVGVGKGADVREAQGKAVAMAKNSLAMINLKGNTIAHEVNLKYGAAKLVIKPASAGTGIIAGSAVKAVAELAGVKDLLSKVLGSRNQINNAYATLEALRSTRLHRI
jgi:small subunit ribosomal protein S5